MNSLGIFAFLVLTVSRWSLVTQASQCKPHNFTVTANYAFPDFPGNLYTCEIVVEVCRGGCDATMKYDVHVQDSNSAKSRCSLEVYHCIASGSQVLHEIPIYDCKIAGTTTAAPEVDGQLVWSFQHGTLTCSCPLLYDTASANECETKFVVP